MIHGEEVGVRSLVLIPDQKVGVLQLHLVVVQVHFFADVFNVVQLFIKDDVVHGPDRVIVKLSFVDEGVRDVTKQEVTFEKFFHFLRRGTCLVLVAIVRLELLLITRKHLKVEIRVLGGHYSALELDA